MMKNQTIVILQQVYFIEEKQYYKDTIKNTISTKLENNSKFLSSQIMFGKVKVNTAKCIPSLREFFIVIFLHLSE